MHRFNKEPVALDPKGLEAAFEAGDDHCRHTALPPRLAYLAAIRAYLAASPSVREIGEPVAWQVFDPNGGEWVNEDTHMVETRKSQGYAVRALYTSPVPQARATPPAPVPAVGEAVVEANNAFLARRVLDIYRRKVAEYDRDYKDAAFTGKLWTDKYGTNLHSIGLGEIWAMRQALAAALAPASPSGVVEALRRAGEAFRTYAKSAEGHHTTKYELANDLRIQADLIDAALAAIEEQAGWREPDRWRAKFNLWFFRELSDEQRLKLFSLHGLPVDEIGLVHGFQRKALDCCLPVSPKQEMK